MTRIKKLRLILLGVGAMNSRRYAPAGLLVERDVIRFAEVAHLRRTGTGLAPQKRKRTVIQFAKAFE